MTLISGGLLATLLGLWERFSGKDIPVWTYVCILAAFVVMASYLAWRDSVHKHAVGMASTVNTHAQEIRSRDETIGKLTNQITAIQAAQPSLDGTVSQVYIDPSGLVCIELSVWNRNKTPTSIREFKIKIADEEAEYPGVGIDIGALSFVPQLLGEERFLNGFELPFRPSPDGYKQGVAESGWLAFALTDTHPGDLQERAKILTLIVVDVFGITHEIQCVGPFDRRGHISQH